MTTVRAATPTEYVTVRSICNAAMLELDTGTLRKAAVLVADEGGRILGSLVLRGPEIEAVAVRPGRRGQGIGTELVEAAKRLRPSLFAEFDSRVRPFYTALGFEIRCSGDRCLGRLRRSNGR